MKIAERKQHYKFDAKVAWRKHVEDAMLAQSFNVTTDNKLIGLWLEPVGDRATCFKQHISSGIIDEPSLIGLDLDPLNMERSKANVKQCRRLFPQARFLAKSWADFCYRSSGKDIRYIVYDLFTTTHGGGFESNMTATFSLVQKALRKSDQVLVCVNADLGVMKRQGRALSDFRKNLLNLVACHNIPRPTIDVDSIYTYKNSKESTPMGSLLLNFH